MNIVLIVNTNNRTTIVDMNNNINKPNIRDEDKDAQGSSVGSVQYNNKASVQDLFKIHDGVRRWRATRGAGGAASMYPSRIIYFRVACPAVSRLHRLGAALGAGTGTFHACAPCWRVCTNL